MHASRSLGTWLASAALMLIVTPGVTAHDFWIELSTFEPKLGEPLRVQLRVGERFVGDPVPRNDARIERFVVAGPAEERAVIGRDGMDPAGLVRLETPGIWFVGYRSKPSSVELSASAFEQYLREEGLERIIDERAARGESGLAGREQFSRSVKAMLRTAGTTSDRRYNRAHHCQSGCCTRVRPSRARSSSRSGGLHGEMSRKWPGSARTARAE
jgi:hypothetical protein